ncbi:MAG: PEP-utilizing enzyme [bacterium]
MSGEVTWEVTRAALAWSLGRVHNPRPVPPLGQDLGMLPTEGANRAHAAFGRPFRHLTQYVNGFSYGAQEPVDAPAAARLNEVEAAATLGRDWEDQYLPEILRIYAAMDAFDADAADEAALLDHLGWALDRMARIWELHFLVTPAYMAINLFLDHFAELFPGATDLEAARLLQGYGNRTTEAAGALDDLARFVAAEGLLPLLRHARTLEDLSSSGPLASRLRAFLAAYGVLGADQGDAFGASWVDAPHRLFAEIVERAGRQEDTRERRARQARDREVALAEARSQLAEEARRRFDQLHDQARVGVILSEDHHFHIDRSVLWRRRRLALAVGARLVRRDVIEHEDDIFFLTLNQVTAALRAPTDLRQQAAARRAEFARWQTLDPPARLGAPPSDGAGRADQVLRYQRRFFGAPQAQTTAGVIRGLAASPGVRSGPARVVTHLEMAGRIRPGDVLVCTTTNASWVTLFDVASAIVTDTGGVLSHCAVVAREYGLPAVVGTGIATRVIADGQMVEVDGTAGEVRLL